LLLEALSYPLRTLDLSECTSKVADMVPLEGDAAGAQSAMLVIAMALLDTEVTFAVVGKTALAEDLLAEDIAQLTLAREVEVADADYLFVCQGGDLTATVEHAKCGTLADPHKSATLIVEDSGAQDQKVELYGPGINGQLKVQLSARAKEALAARDGQHYEYPQGVDLLFVSAQSELFAIPRMVRAEENSWLT